MPLDSRQEPPYYLAPKAFRPEILVDEHRNFVCDPTGTTFIGFDGPIGAMGELGRLAYTTRTPASRGF